MKSSSSFSVLAPWLTLRPGSLGCIGQLSCVSHLTLGLEHSPAPTDVQEKSLGKAGPSSMKIDEALRESWEALKILSRYTLCFTSSSLPFVEDGNRGFFFSSLSSQIPSWSLGGNLNNTELIHWQWPRRTWSSFLSSSLFPLPSFPSYPHLKTSHLGKFYF